MSNIEALRRRIKDPETGREMTQAELAQQIGVTESTIANWERSRTGTEWFERVAKLCEVLSCQPKELIIYEELSSEEEKTQ